MFSKIGDILLLMPLALMSFSGLPINDNYDLGIQGNKLFIILRTEFWLIISVIFNFMRTINFNFSLFNKNIKNIIFNFPFLNILIISFSTFINIMGKTGYVESITFSSFREYLFLLIWLFWSLLFLISLQNKNNIIKDKFLELFIILPIPNLIIMALMPFFQSIFVKQLGYQGLYTWGNRFQGVGSNPNVGASISFLSLVAILIVLENRRSYYSALVVFLMYLALAGNIMIIIQSGVRTIYISVACLFILNGYKFIIRNIPYLLFGIIIFILAGGLSYYDFLLPQNTFLRDGREMLWNYYFQFFPNIFGYGINWRHFISRGEYIDNILDPHNIYLASSLTGGTLLMLSIILKQLFLLKLIIIKTNFKAQILSLFLFLIFCSFFADNLDSFSQHFVPVLICFLYYYYPERNINLSTKKQKFQKRLNF